ncbi:MAG: hypothetical protein IT562_07195, partial [Alphaproteobacteria bacterium]|nr:hypothetical protein [Alphaproteobacteria bacterium]
MAQQRTPATRVASPRAPALRAAEPAAAAQRLTGAEIIIKALLDQGVEVVFGYPGGAVLPIYDAL